MFHVSFLFIIVHPEMCFSPFLIDCMRAQRFLFWREWRESLFSFLYKFYTYQTGLSLNRHTRIMMWRSKETLLLFVAVGRKRLLKKRQDVLEEELQNLYTPFKGKEHGDGWSLWRRRVSSGFTVDGDKYLRGIFTHVTRLLLFVTFMKKVALYYYWVIYKLFVSIGRHSFCFALQNVSFYFFPIFQ